ncbi:MAG TPA: hypothetical protein VGD11_10285, partial [Mycobacteriales bacterium]
ISAEEVRALQDEWAERDIPVPLLVLDSPYRDITGPLLDYIAELRQNRPRDVIVVYIPEYVVGRWWEHLLHNQSALRLKTRLLFEPGIMVTSVPWQLQSTNRRDLDRVDRGLTDARRSIVRGPDGAVGRTGPVPAPAPEPDGAADTDPDRPLASDVPGR